MPATAKSGITAYAWRETTAPRVVPMVWASPDQNTTIEAAEDRADQVATALLTRPPGDRVLFLWDPLHTQDWSRPDLTALFGLVPSPGLILWQSFFLRLADLGAEPDLLVTDYEGAPSYWGWGAEANVSLLATVKAGLKSRALLPLILREAEPGVLRGYGPPALAWQEFITGRMVRTLFDRSILAAYSSAFGHKPAISDWWDLATDGAVPDENGSPLPDARALPAGLSSPDVYLSRTGSSFGSDKPHEWDKFVHRVRLLRACRRVGESLLPWFPPTQFSFDGQPAPTPLYREVLRHLHAMGCRRLLYWNANSTDAEDAGLGSLLQESASWPRLSLRDLPDLQYGCDEVVTGSVTTRFADVQAALKAPATLPKVRVMTRMQRAPWQKGKGHAL